MLPFTTPSMSSPSDVALQVHHQCYEKRTTYPKENYSLLQAYTDEGLSSDSPPVRLLEALIARTWSCSLNQLGAFETLREEDEWQHGGDNFILPRGFSQLVEYLAGTIKGNKNATLRLNCPVKHIDYSTEETLQVQLASGAIKCKAVIITVPLPVLKDSDITFSPPLPNWKLDALKCLEMGHATKIACRFSKKLWPDHIRLLLTDHALFGQIWMLGAVGHRPDSEQSYVATAFITGPNAVLLPTAVVVGGPAALRGLSSEEMKSVHPKGLTLQFVRYMAKVFTGSEDGAPDLFESAVLYNWDDNPFVRGAYSYPSLLDSVDVRKRVAAPLAGNRVLFAGEHTATGSVGTVQAAMLTARKAVNSLTETLRARSKL